MKILVADDQPAIVEYVSKLLRSWGYDVLALHCGNHSEAAEVLKHIRFIRFDVAVIGYKMPCLRGTNAAIQIKRFWPSTNVIVAMESVPPEESLRLHREGLEFRELTCPFEEDELFERLH